MSHPQIQFLSIYNLFNLIRFDGATEGVTEDKLKK
jgi:hypothetical protein